MKNKKPTISMIAAISENHALGKNNKLLWHIPEDFQKFKKITLGHPVIMGEKTFNSIGKPLPGRLNIVLSKNKNLQIKDCVIADSIPEAIFIAKEYDNNEIFFIGGGSIYSQALDLADRLYLTIVEGKFDADTFFPEFVNIFHKVSGKKSSNKKYKYCFTVWEK